MEIFTNDLLDGLAKLFLGFIVFAIIYGIITESRSKKIKNKLSQINDFSPNRIVINENGSYIFAADDNAEKFAYITQKLTQKFGYKDIISVEIIEDGQVVSKKSISRTIGGAIIGGVFAGGVGTVVGGLSGGSKQKTKVSMVLVKILLRNQFTTSLTINCFKDGIINFDDLKDARNQANLIKDIVSIIIDKMDRQELSNSYKESKQTQNLSISDELMKLNDLKEKGVITEYEFIVLKDKLLKS